jgi:endonuclease/exonuclease/phosphatase family metal-dependent hydrolase
MTRKWRSWLAAAGVLAAVLTVQPATSATSATSVPVEVRYTFFHFNMAGNVNHAGRTQFIVPAVVSSITSTWPSAVSLNEVCANQFREIYWGANAAGGGYHGRFATTIPQGTPGVCNGEAYGLALLVQDASEQSFAEFSLPVQPSAEPRKLICATKGVAGNPAGLKICNTHLQGGDQKYVQMKVVSEKHLIPAARAGQAVAFMGDTYLDEDEMRFSTAGLYAHTALGNTSKNPNCRATEWANPQWKLGCPGRLTEQNDYVMVSTNRFHSLSGAVTSTVWSDHLPVRGAASLR